MKVDLWPVVSPDYLSTRLIDRRARFSNRKNRYTLDGLDSKLVLGDNAERVQCWSAQVK